MAKALATAVRTFQVDKAHSEVDFQVRHLITKVRGRFTDYAGTIEFDQADPSHSKVDFTIQAASIDTAEPKRDEHLRSDDFFAATTFPTLTFTSTSGVRERGPVIDNVRDTTAPDVVKTKVWNTWTGGSVSSTTAPLPTDSAWHPTKGDPQSQLHRSDKHVAGVPYFVPKGKSGGDWFLWLEV